MSPTVYFIDDSATMREVIRGAFQREKMTVVTCPDAATALAQMEDTKPDIVITDVIMPDKDGYEVCQFIKRHPQLNATPVILLSGVVSREVAEKAFRVQADELIRKPFLPHDLITRVRQLIGPKSFISAAPAANPGPGATLGSIFAGTAAFRGQSAAAAVPTLVPLPSAGKPAVARSANVPSSATEVYRLRLEVLRLQNLVKKLRSELDAEREYGRALDTHIKSLQESSDLGPNG